MKLTVENSILTCEHVIKKERKPYYTQALTEKECDSMTCFECLDTLDEKYLVAVHKECLFK